ncbi:MAG: DNRLRE domain-containing protein, partial [Bacillota bacterium]|nr:DNRLRE domain-containing protein [Bacillota bacterium]
MSNLKWCLKNQQLTRCYGKAVCYILTFALLLVPSFTSVRAADLPAETIGSESDSTYTILDQNNQSCPYIATDDEAHTELISQRTAAGKTYLLDSKRYEAVVFASPVHYLQDGEYRQIDNSLEATTTDAGSVRYTNRANSFTASFADRLGDGQTVSISKEGSTLSWSIDGLRQGIPATAATSLSESEWSGQSKGEQRRTIPNLATQITYRDVLPDTHLEVWLIADHVKENLVLEKDTGLKTVSQTITADSIELALQAGGSIQARNGETVVFFLPAPYACDASGDNIVNIDVTLEESTAGEKGDMRVYQLTWHLDADWMASAAYPVTIDPTVYTSLAQSDIKDALISENYPNVNYGLNAKLNTGEGSSSATNYSLIRFPELPAIGSASMVQYSGLRLTKKTLAAADSIVTVHEVTSTWDSMSVTWATCPSFSSNVDDWQTVDKEAGGAYEWDITRIAKKWYTGSTNYGVLLKDISQTGAKQEYYSSDSGSIVPYAYFVYTNYTGLEGYWDYTGSSLGRSGAASINLYNGNLVYTHSDVAMTGNRLPIAVTHVFNSTTRDDNDSKMLYGRGWRTNYDQRVSTVTIGTVNYYKYVDEDGTIHYFRQVNGVWKDESGLDLRLTVASYVVTITDKNGNFLVFHPTNSATKPGFLNYIQDRNGNRQTVGYDANSRISQVTDAAGRIVKFNRDANGNLTQIGEPTAGSTWRYTTFAYTSSRLTSITYPDGEVTSLVYDANGNLDYVSRNIDYADGSGTNKTALSKLDLAYTSLAPYRVTYVGELATVSGTTTDGAHAHLSYGYNCTTLEDSEGRKATYQLNDSGNTVCVTGPDGGAAYAGYGTDSASGSMSKATSVSRFQKFSKNLLQNHNAELSSNWVLFSASGSTGTHTYATDQKYLGNQSIKLVKTNTTAYEAAQQTVTLVKGVTYTFSGYIKTSGISESSMGAQIRAGYYNSSSAYVAVSSTCVKGTQDWTRYNLTFTLPADATSTTVYLFCLV